MADLTVAGPDDAIVSVAVTTTDPAQPVILTENVIASTTENASATVHASAHGAMNEVEMDDGNVPVRRRFRTLATVASLYLVIFVVAMDQTIVATAIPTICHDLHSASGYTWIGAAYLLASAATGPLWAKASDIWGRKLILLTAVAIFACASIIAALSVDMAMLIAGRALQGIAGGGLGSLVAITISDLFSIRERSLYLGLMGGVWAVAGSAGPVVGGVFATLVSWRWIFWINLPICGCAFVTLLVFMKVHNPRTKLGQGIKVIDWIGVVSILAIAILLLLGLNFGGAIFPWSSTKVICLLVFGTVTIGLFVINEKRLAEYPLIPLGVFGTIDNNAVFLVAIAHSILASGIEYYLPLFFQSVRGASPLRSGVLLLPYVLAAASTDVAAGIFIHRTGRYREQIWAGAALMTLGAGLYINFWVDTPLAEIIGLEIIQSVGVALLFQTPMIALQNVVKQNDVASTTAALSFLRNLATSLSIVLGGVVFQNSMASRHSALALAGVQPSILEALSGPQAAANVHVARTVPAGRRRQAILEAFAWSTRNMWIMYTCIGGVAVFASFFVKQKAMSKEHTETKTGVDHLSRREEKNLNNSTDAREL